MNPYFLSLQEAIANDLLDYDCWVEHITLLHAIADENNQ